MVPALEGWALDVVLPVCSCVITARHRITPSGRLCSNQNWCSPVDFSISSLQDRNTGSFLGLSFFLVGNTPHLSPGVLCSYRQWMSLLEREGTFVMILPYILGGENQKRRRLFVQGPCCYTWTFELLLTATSKTDSFRNNIINYDLNFFVASKATSSY